MWFQPLDDLAPRDGAYVDPDYQALFTGDGAWAAVVSTFAINSVYAVAATDAGLKAMGSFLAAHRIALNVDLPMLPTQASRRWRDTRGRSSASTSPTA